MVTDSPVLADEFVPVRSRIAWSAIVAGSVLALSLYFLLAILGSAVGFSLGDKVSPHSLSVGAAMYAIVVTAACLFLGGYVATQLTTGENRMEGSLYGLFVWATVFALLVGMLAAGVKVGLNAMVGVATAGTVAETHAQPGDWEASARQTGVPQERIDEWKAKAKESPAATRQVVQNPQNQQDAAEAATRVSWYAFFGALISMLAAAAGGYVGTVRTFRLFAVSVGRAPHNGRPVVARA